VDHKEGSKSEPKEQVRIQPEEKRPRRRRKHEETTETDTDGTTGETGRR
jgi:hypothetical protein